MLASGLYGNQLGNARERLSFQSVSLIPGDVFEIQSGIDDLENDYHGAFVTSKIGRLQIENEDIFNHAAPINPEEYDKEADPFR